MKEKEENFVFKRDNKNRIVPRQLRKVDIMKMVRNENSQELNQIINDLCTENFEENDYFDFSKDELKIIKNYQVLTQYMIYSINKLTRKSEKLKVLNDNQIEFNQNTEKMIKMKENKIREQEETINDLTNDCANLEYLIKQLNLENKAKNEGIDLNNKK